VPRLFDDLDSLTATAVLRGCSGCWSRSISLSSIYV
jgi:hypothetical protein